jgi:UDP-N-acetylmuramyl pentapeptide phosphotransferase/UDP-N-acetylglucosamine-1-phosphate transferase
VASLFAIWLLGLAIHSVGVPLIDRLFLEFPMLAILFTCFALAGMANAINIIDGFNGLAAFVSITIALSLSYVAFTLNDQFVGLNSLILAGALAGFAVLNYPFGRIFLGDGGAYITGFALGILSIMLVENNKQVSAWFPILLFFYPIFETLFSFYRKRFIRGIPAMEPDGAHLHMLVYGRMVPRTSTLPVIGSWTKNSRTMPYLWIFSATCNILSVQFISSDTLLLVSIFCSIGAYIYFYRKLVHWGRVTKK